MKHRDVKQSAQFFFDVETLGSLYILKVDAAECRCNGLYCRDYLFGFVLAYLDVESVDVGKDFEKHCLALHYRLRGQGTYVAHSKHCAAVRDNRYKIALVGVAVGFPALLVNLLYRSGYSWRIRERKLFYCAERLRGCNLGLSGSFIGMVIQRPLLQLLIHDLLFNRIFCYIYLNRYPLPKVPEMLAFFSFKVSAFFDISCLCYIFA